MAELTAVQWLKQQYRERGETLPSGVFQDALDMEKEQLKKAHYHNRCINNQTYECTMKAFEDAEQYYNETYKDQTYDTSRTLS